VGKMEKENKGGKRMNSLNNNTSLVQSLSSLLRKVDTRKKGRKEGEKEMLAAVSLSSSTFSSEKAGTMKRRGRGREEGERKRRNDKRKMKPLTIPLF